MYRKCYLAARPETLLAIVHTGQLPDSLPEWFLDREIMLYPAIEKAVSASTAKIGETFILSINVPLIEKSFFATLVKEKNTVYFKTPQINKDWITHIYVNSKIAEKLAINLLNTQSPVPIEINKEFFPKISSFNKIDFVTHAVIQPKENIRYMKQGDLLGSKMQTLVNTVNCVGIMGKGIALAFKQRYPTMFKEYQKKCQNKEVHLGEPYVFCVNSERKIINFPTKNHWRKNSEIQSIENGLKYLTENIKNWGIESMAIPPLGCGNGGLDWKVVEPLIQKYLKNLEIPIEIYVPFSKPENKGTKAVSVNTLSTTITKKRKREEEKSKQEGLIFASSNVISKPFKKTKLEENPKTITSFFPKKNELLEEDKKIKTVNI